MLLNDTTCFLLAIFRILCYAISGTTSTPVGGSPVIFRGRYASLPPINNREGVTAMNITWEEIFQFCMLVVAVINLVLQVNDKKK